jgi:UDPglucose--hexose-1-phosphate uridylyltransferase
MTSRKKPRMKGSGPGRPEMRYHPLLDRWVILAPGRDRRPFDQEDRALSAAEDCPFCPGNERATPPEILAVPAQGAWRVRVVPNKYPALEPGIPEEAPESGGEGSLFLRRPGRGIHEVIVESPDHEADLSMLDPGHIADILGIWASRIREAYRLPGVAYALVFKNHRSRAGASLAHPHSQLIATPVLPGNIRQKAESSKTYQNRTGGCLLCALLRKERETQTRILDRSGGFCVLAPYASRFPYEVMIAPEEHLWDFAGITGEQALRLAVRLREILGKLKGLLGDPPFNLVLNSAPNFSVLTEAWARDRPERFFHWHLEIMPRLASVAGFEWGSGFHINTVAPEEAARRLRDY